VEASLDRVTQLWQHRRVALRLSEYHDVAVVVQDRDVELKRRRGQFEEDAFLGVTEVDDRVDVRGQLGEVLGVVPAARLRSGDQSPAPARSRPVCGIEPAAALDLDEARVCAGEEERTSPSSMTFVVGRRAGDSIRPGLSS
jgi:hypothetical protein